MKKRTRIQLATLLSALVLVLTVHYMPRGFAQPSSAQPDPIKVIDGDTFRVGVDRIRLWGIDAPELHQDCWKDQQEVQCGQAAKVMLMGILRSGALTCQTVDQDRYHRFVSQCKVDGLDVGGLMVQSGWAIDYSSYSANYYKEWEDQARTRRTGLWGLQFDIPADWRKGTRRNSKQESK